MIKIKTISELIEKLRDEKFLAKIIIASQKDQNIILELYKFRGILKQKIHNYTKHGMDFKIYKENLRFINKKIALLKKFAKTDNL